MTKVKVKYAKEFREEAVKLALQSKEPKSIIADELGVKRNTLYNWISKAMQEKVGSPRTHGSNSTKYHDLEQENRSLRAQLKRTQQERDILKKAAAYFANQEL